MTDTTQHCPLCEERAREIERLREALRTLEGRALVYTRDEFVVCTNCGGSTPEGSLESPHMEWCLFAAPDEGATSQEEPSDE